MVLSECLLHGVQLAVAGDALDGSYLGAIGLCRQHGAGFHRAAIDVNQARAALAGIATHVGAGEPQLIPEQVDQQGSVFHFRRYRIAVQRHRDVYRHDYPPYLLVVAAGTIVRAAR